MGFSHHTNTRTTTILPSHQATMLQCFSQSYGNLDDNIISSKKSFAKNDTLWMNLKSEWAALNQLSLGTGSNTFDSQKFLQGGITSIKPSKCNQSCHTNDKHTCNRFSKYCYNAKCNTQECFDSRHVSKSLSPTGGAMVSSQAFTKQLDSQQTITENDGGSNQLQGDQHEFTSLNLSHGSPHSSPNITGNIWITKNRCPRLPEGQNNYKNGLDSSLAPLINDSILQHCNTQATYNDYNYCSIAPLQDNIRYTVPSVSCLPVTSENTADKNSSNFQNLFVNSNNTYCRHRTSPITLMQGHIRNGNETSVAKEIANKKNNVFYSNNDVSVFKQRLPFNLEIKQNSIPCISPSSSSSSALFTCRRLGSEAPVTAAAASLAPEDMITLNIPSRTTSYVSHPSIHSGQQSFYSLGNGGGVGSMPPSIIPLHSSSVKSSRSSVIDPSSLYSMGQVPSVLSSSHGSTLSSSHLPLSSNLANRNIKGQEQMQQQQVFQNENEAKLTVSMGGGMACPCERHDKRMRNFARWHTAKEASVKRTIQNKKNSHVPEFREAFPRKDQDFNAITKTRAKRVRGIHKECLNTWVPYVDRHPIKQNLSVIRQQQGNGKTKLPHRGSGGTLASSGHSQQQHVQQPAIYNAAPENSNPASSQSYSTPGTHYLHDNLPDQTSNQFYNSTVTPHFPSRVSTKELNPSFQGLRTAAFGPEPMIQCNYGQQQRAAGELYDSPYLNRINNQHVMPLNYNPNFVYQKPNSCGPCTVINPLLRSSVDQHKLPLFNTGEDPAINQFNNRRNVSTIPPVSPVQGGYNSFLLDATGTPLWNQHPQFLYNTQAPLEPSYSLPCHPFSLAEYYSRAAVPTIQKQQVQHPHFLQQSVSPNRHKIEGKVTLTTRGSRTYGIPEETKKLIKHQLPTKDVGTNTENYLRHRTIKEKQGSGSDEGLIVDNKNEERHIKGKRESLKKFQKLEEEKEKALKEGKREKVLLTPAPKQKLQVSLTSVKTSEGTKKNPESDTLNASPKNRILTTPHKTVTKPSIMAGLKKKTVSTKVSHNVHEPNSCAEKPKDIAVKEVPSTQKKIESGSKKDKDEIKKEPEQQAITSSSRSKGEEQKRAVMQGEAKVNGNASPEFPKQTMPIPNQLSVVSPSFPSKDLEEKISPYQSFNPYVTPSQINTSLGSCYNNSDSSSTSDTSTTAVEINLPENVVVASYYDKDKNQTPFVSITQQKRQAGVKELLSAPTTPSSKDDTSSSSEEDITAKTCVLPLMCTNVPVFTRRLRNLS